MSHPPSKQKAKTTTVREHQRHVPVSAKNPGGITIVDRHLRRIPGTSLDRNEIASTFATYDKSKILRPTPHKITQFKNADEYDELIAMWADYFSKKLNVDPALDPDVIKALIASESGFRKDPKENRIAFGITQITKSTLEIVQDSSGEAKEFIFNQIRQKDLKDPEVAIAIAARWLSRKKNLAKSKLGREPTAEEVILEYKGLLRSSTKYKDKALANFREYYEMLKAK